MKMKTASLCFLFVLVLAGSAWAQTPVGAAAPTPLASQNHYKCYDIPQHQQFAPRNVALRDQFGITQGQAVRPILHCNPVNKNGEGIPYPDVHLLCYELVEAPYLGIWPLNIQNQFGSLNIRADQPRVLCVPSYKFHVTADAEVEKEK